MTKTTLIISRHGNTFGPQDTPTRCGAHTDLPLVESGLKQADTLGLHLKQFNPTTFYSGPLLRHIQTADAVIDHCAPDADLLILDNFSEIDYGPDENKTEDAVIARLGQDAIRAWNESATVPDGWIVDVDKIIQDWLDIGTIARDHHAGQISYLCSSNGIMRFIPHMTGDFDGFKKKHDLKIKTGAYCILTHETGHDHWDITTWNARPS